VGPALGVSADMEGGKVEKSEGLPRGGKTVFKRHLPRQVKTSQGCPYLDGGKKGGDNLFAGGGGRKRSARGLFPSGGGSFKNEVEVPRKNKGGLPFPGDRLGGG